MSNVKDYSVEELNLMPLSFIRNLDVRNKEEEIILQAVVSEKMKSAPVENIPQLTVEEQKLLDSPMLTPEKEREIQARLDERRAKYRAVIVGEKVPSIENLEVENPIELATEETMPEVKSTFCEFCSSKGVRHLKVCTRTK